MSAEDLSKMYQQDFRAALECLEEGDNDEAILAANQALMDLNLPPYWQVQACILIACLEDDWDEAEVMLSFLLHLSTLCFRARDDGHARCLLTFLWPLH
jgi:hypothetical protein